MTLRLILLRHAKSSWDDLSLDDHDRVLNARGQRSCTAIGGWMAERGYTPDEVLCSTSARTQETWARLAEHLTGTPAPTLLRNLYLADAQTIFDVLSEAKGRCVALLGHNPGIAAFAGQMVSEKPDHLRFQRFPTLSTLVLDFPITSWSKLAPASGKVADFIVPRDLTD